MKQHNAHSNTKHYDLENLH